MWDSGTTEFCSPLCHNNPSRWCLARVGRATVFHRKGLIVKFDGGRAWQLRKEMHTTREAGIPVEYVNPAYTSQTCHEWGHLGPRLEQAEFRCTNDDCWVSEYQADINAAANIAARVNPWERAYQ